MVENTEIFVRELLAKRLDPEFTFHNFRHAQHVLEAASQLCELEGCSDAETEIVKLAALFHDAGFTRPANCHEEESVCIASLYLKKEGYPPHQVEQVKRCILATKKGAEAHDKIERIMQDADMAHLASDHYFGLLADLRFETEKILNQRYTDRAWLEKNLSFIQSHVYKTNSGKMLWNELKAKNIQQNKQLLTLL